MKNLFILTSVFLISCSSSDKEVRSTISDNTTINIPTNTDVPTDWMLVWEEEFDTNLDDWEVWNSGAFNEEIQLYKPENIKLEDGLLKISAVREDINGTTNPYDNTPKDFEYTSGRLETKQTFGPTNISGQRSYRIISRIKLPKGNGMWPAFWTTADPWPTKGEIDILEARGNNPTKFQSNIFYGPNPSQPVTKSEDTEKKYDPEIDLTNSFHNYELIWNEDTLQIVFDGEVLHTYIADNKNFIGDIFGSQHNIILNLAVGGVFFSDKNSENYSDTGSMEVDWVKVYRK